MKLKVAAAVGLVGVGLLFPAVASAAPYTSCAQAAKDGVYNIPKSSPNYDPDLDRDGDGIACEQD